MNWTINGSNLPYYLGVKTSGRVTLDGYIAMWDDICSQPTWKPGTNVLFDNRGIDPVGADGYEMTSKASEYFRSKLDAIGNGKIALLMKHHSHLPFGYQFNYKIGHTEQRLVFFFDESSALEWMLQRTVSAG